MTLTKTEKASLGVTFPCIHFITDFNGNPPAKEQEINWISREQNDCLSLLRRGLFHWLMPRNFTGRLFCHQVVSRIQIRRPVARSQTLKQIRQIVRITKTTKEKRGMSNPVLITFIKILLRFTFIKIKIFRVLCPFKRLTESAPFNGSCFPS